MQRRAALVFLPAFPAYIISRFATTLSGGNEKLSRILYQLPGILDVLSEINLAAFYFSGVYYDLVRRFLRIRNVSNLFLKEKKKNAKDFAGLIYTRESKRSASVIFTSGDTDCHTTHPSASFDSQIFPSRQRQGRVIPIFPEVKEGSEGRIFHRGYHRWHFVVRTYGSDTG